MRIKSNNLKTISGFTLIELVMALVVLGVGVGVFLILIINSTSRSADPMVIQQANAIAQAYLEEILLNPFCDPDNFSTDCPADCDAAAVGAGSVCTACGGGAETRPNYDDVCDYAGVNDTAGALDITGNTIAGLERYNVSVNVNGSSANLNGLTSANGQAIRVDVTVTHDNFIGLGLTVSGYKANY